MKTTYYTCCAALSCGDARMYKARKNPEVAFDEIREKSCLRENQNPLSCHRRLKSHGFRMREQIEAAEVIDFGPCALQKFGAMNDERKALRSADRNVEAIGIEQKVRAAGRVDAFRGRHRDDDN